jgi:hypothetical protein
VDRSGHWIYGIQSGSASTFNTGQINGQPAITLNGSFKLSSEQSGNKAMTHFSGAVTMFAVVKASSNSANNPIIGGGQSDWEWRISTSKLQEVLQEQIASLGTSTTAANTSWHQLNFTCTVNSLISSSLNPIFRTDGASDATLSGAACNNIAQDVTKGFTNIGGAPAVAEQFSGQIAEFIAYGRVLSSTEIAQVEAYFHAKYGL